MNINLNNWSKSFINFFAPPKKNFISNLSEPLSRRNFLNAAAISTLALISNPTQALGQISTDDTNNNSFHKELFEIDNWLNKFNPKAKQELIKLVKQSKLLAIKTKKDPYNIFLLRSISQTLHKNGYKLSSNNSNHIFSQSLVNKELNHENLTYLTYTIAKLIKPSLKITFASNEGNLHLLINSQPSTKMLWQAKISNQETSIFDSIKNDSSKAEILSKNQIFSKYISKASLLFQKIDNKKNILNQSLKFDQQNDLAHFYYAQLYHSQGNKKQALEHFNKAIEINPSNDSYYKARSDYYFKNDSFINSFSDLQQAYKLNPKKHQSELYQKLAFLTAMILSVAMLSHRGIKTHSEIKKTRQGDKLFDEKMYCQALKKYTQALKLNPSEIKILQRRAICYKEMGEFEGAIKDLNKIINIVLKNNGAISAQTLSQYFQAKALCHSAQSNKGNDAEIALKSIEKAIAMDPQSHESFFARAKIKESSKHPDTDSIISDFSKALELYSKANPSTKAENHISNEKINYSTELTKSIVTLKESLSDEHFEKLLAHFTMFFRSQNDDRVKSFLRLLAEKEDHSYKSLYHYCGSMIEYYWHLNKAKALTHIDKSLALKEDFQEAKDLKKIIETAQITQPISKNELS